MQNKLKKALFFTKGSIPTSGELEEAKALELKRFLDIKLRNGAAFKRTGSPEAAPVICGRITTDIKSCYPTAEIATLDGEAPVIEQSDPANAPAGAKPLESMSVDELTGYVKQHDYQITGFSSMPKAEKLNAILGHEASLTAPTTTDETQTAPETTPETGNDGAAWT